MQAKVEHLSSKIQDLIEDNTQQAIEINTLTDELSEKVFKLKTLTHELDREKETNIVIRDSILRFSNETSLSGLIKVCANYIMHYYNPSIATFYISNDVIMDSVNEGEEGGYNHMYDFTRDNSMLSTKPERLSEIFKQMIMSHQTVKPLSSYDLGKLEEPRTEAAIICKIQYSNTVIGFLLMEYAEEERIQNENLLNLLLEVFANNYSILLITKLLAEQYDTARTQAYYDVKTGIPNTRQFHADLAELGEDPFCLVSIDIDNFKGVNDKHGHDVGDEVLHYVGQTLDKYMQRLGGRGYREGGDEFFGLSLRTLDETIEFVEVMFNELWTHVFTDAQGTEFTIGNSAGIYERQNGENIESVKKKVDILLYNSKETGKKKFTVDQLVTID